MSVQPGARLIQIRICSLLLDSSLLPLCLAHLSNSEAAELSIKPIITVLTAAHRPSHTSQDLTWVLSIDVCIASPPSKQLIIDLKARALYFERLLFRNCNFISPSLPRRAEMYLGDQKVAVFPFLIPLLQPKIIDICSCKFASSGLLLPARWHFGRIFPSHRGVEIMATELRQFYIWFPLLRWI